MFDLIYRLDKPVRQFFCRIAVAICFFSLVGTVNTALAEYQQGVIQQTRLGKVKGYVANHKMTLVWKAVPYAQAPVGELRWQAPQPAQPWTGIFNAKRASSICPQIKSGQYLGDEDCLTVDIYRPHSATTNLPVLFYIHGGNNQLGDSSEINPEQLVVDANAIVVSVNYRLGALGFNNLPALRGNKPYEASGNFGLLDIYQALQWVKRDIAQFGGNPGNVTLAGFSAGGRDVMATLISPLFKGQFQQAISFSGGMTLADYQASTPIIARALAPLVVADGIHANELSATNWLLTSDQSVREYLTRVSAKRLSGRMINAGIRMAVFPHLYNDGQLIPKKGFQSKQYNQVPIIMFSGAQEFSLFAFWDKRFSAVPQASLIDDSLTAREFAFAKKYGSDFYTLFNTQAAAQTMLPHYQAPIYTAVLTWGQDKAIAGDAAALFGPYHGIWIPFLTGEVTETATHFKTPLNSAGARQLAQVFTQYIRNFLWRGNPNGEGLVHWNAWQSVDKGSSHLLLNADRERAQIAMSDKRMSYESIIAGLQADLSIPAPQKQQLIRQVLNGRWFSKPLDEHFGNEGEWIITP